MKMKRAFSLLMAGIMSVTMLTGCGDASSFTEIFDEKDSKEKVTVALWGNQIEVEAKAAGVTAFCAKPMFMSDLREALLTALGKQEKKNEQLMFPVNAADDFKGRRMLLAEDNELNREIAVEILEAYGFQIDMAEDGAQALNKVSASKPGDYDLILMDIQMPVMDGYEATRAIRALDVPDAATIPIIAVSANAFAEDMQKSLKAGMNEHIAKPFNKVKLEEVLGRYL